MNPKPKCIWALDDDDSGCWQTDCSNAFIFNEGGCKENNFKFCPYCGKTLKEIVNK